MKMEQVASKAISAIGYDPATKQMRVHFKSGGTYQHENVSPAEHDALVKAGSACHSTPIWAWTLIK